KFRLILSWVISNLSYYFVIFANYIVTQEVGCDPLLHNYTDTTKEIEKQCPRIQPWPKESKSNGHGSRRGQKNRKATATDQTVAKEIEKQCPRIKRWPKELKRNGHERNRGHKNGELLK
ncbi:MAG TPA: hypothetical protein H9829_04770, partial [Candidatus Tetragenococcus pullicola]|nr:hypothetical protein [Candidatus Tetragenococcus pullicola]